MLFTSPSPWARDISSQSGPLSNRGPRGLAEVDAPSDTSEMRTLGGAPSVSHSNKLNYARNESWNPALLRADIPLSPDTSIQHGARKQLHSRLHGADGTARGSSSPTPPLVPLWFLGNGSEMKEAAV
ncbi:unnamed protein product [Arctogadus glacialis]